jgi:pyruvate formate-lyase/glycerol dehydratase family glycyl radical enzyme
MSEKISGEKGNPYSARIAGLREDVLGAPELCVERGFLMTESYKETEGEPSIIRRAKALKKILSEMTISIDDNELIVGKTTSKKRGAFIIPEIQWEWYLEQIDALSTREWDKLKPISENEKQLMKSFLPYWKGKSTYDKWHAIVPDELMTVNNSNLYVINTSSLSGVHIGHIVADNEKVLTLGLNHIKKEVEDKIASLCLSEIDDFKKLAFYQAVLISLDAVITFSGRYARLAREMAAVETDEQRKAELIKIAEISERVPEGPANTFHEAIQSLWFIFIALRIEVWGPGVSIGRPDQYLYPFFKNDINEGILTEEEASELILMLLIKMNDAAIPMSTAVVEQLAGFPTVANITIGGVTRQGKNAVNDLTYLFLEAERNIGLSMEEFVIRVNRLNSDAFIRKACEVAKDLKGKLKFISDDTAIQQMLNNGKSIEDARDYVVVGCFSPTVPAKSLDITASTINMPLLLELALNDGVSRMTGKRLGPATGDPRGFKDYDELWNAFKTQVQAVIPAGVALRNMDRQVYADFVPAPFLSAVYPSCIESGIDIINGGTSPLFTEAHGLSGVPNVGDSLAAVKKMVFEEKKITMEQLINALDRNFNGEERLVHILSKSPKFGNDIDYVDSIVNDVITFVCDEMNKYKGIAGTKHIVAIATGTGHMTFGSVVGALPDGRKACEPLSEGGISPHQGRNISGPTATLRSVAKLDHIKASGGSVLNMKINPDALNNDLKIKKFISMLRTYCETGGYHVQFNIISGETLRDAQKNPEKYRDLLVRVATYSAYFVDLSPTLQDDIIARIEFGEL